MVEEIFKDGLIAFVFQGGDEDYERKENHSKFVPVDEGEIF
jgi:hypothetical protein